MTITEAKNFIKSLHKDDLMYHLDDDAVDCLYESNKVTTLKRAKAIQKTVDEIFEAELDWGIHDCPHGYCLHLIAMDKAS
jgi:hypothetical protein